MSEKCYFHKDVEAQVWREAFVFGEPPRVPLCCECATEAKGFPLHPMNEVHFDMPPGFEMAGYLDGEPKNKLK